MTQPSVRVRSASTGVGGTRAVVVVLYGGKPRSLAPSRPWHLSAVRMVPFARSIHDAGADQGIAVWTLRYRYRGWNEPAESPVADARWALDEVRRRHGDVPVVLVVHSMGGRTALRVAGDPSVRGLVALAPWLPPDEPVEQLRDRSMLIMHGSRDRWTDPGASLDLARRAASVTSVRRVEVKGVGHPMLRRASVWHDLTTQFVLSRLDQSDRADRAYRADRADQSTEQMGTNHSYGIPTGIFQQI